MLVDTNLFIDFLKGVESSKKFFQNSRAIATSSIVIMEVIAGFSMKREIASFEKFIKNTGIIVLPITPEISNTAYLLFRDTFHKSRIGIPDAFIAATAIENGLELMTLNDKHFRSIKKLDVLRPY